MNWETIAAGIATIAIFSFLYRDNPLYRLTEHILIGLSVGYSIVLVWNSVLVPKLLSRLFVQGDLWSVIPFVLSLLVLARVKRSLTFLSKPVLALVIGAGAGISVPTLLDARIIKQMSASIQPFAAPQSGDMITAVISLVAVITVIFYFFYTRPNRPLSNGISKAGIYFLMIFFGATFGYTVTSRLTLLIGRLEFLLSDLFGII